MERKMFFGTYPEIFATAKHLRKNMTCGEKMLWNELRMNKLGVRFKPQHPMMFYIADFYSYKLKLTIEIDGPIHDSKIEHDAIRTEDLESAGNILIRFSNDDVIYRMPDVLRQIKLKIEEIIAQNKSDNINEEDEN